MWRTSGTGDGSLFLKATTNIKYCFKSEAGSEFDIFLSEGSFAGQKDPSPVPRPLVKARGAVHPLPRERENRFCARGRDDFSLSRGERVAEGRGRVRGLLTCPPPLRGQRCKASGFARLLTVRDYIKCSNYM